MESDTMVKYRARVRGQKERVSMTAPITLVRRFSPSPEYSLAVDDNGGSDGTTVGDAVKVLKYFLATPDLPAYDVAFLASPDQVHFTLQEDIGAEALVEYWREKMKRWRVDTERFKRGELKRQPQDPRALIDSKGERTIHPEVEALAEIAEQDVPALVAARQYERRPSAICKE